LVLLLRDDNIVQRRLKGRQKMTTHNSNSKEVGTSKTEPTAAANGYQKPTLVKLGSFVELTQALIGSISDGIGPGMQMMT
jgi:hypothetical protein